MFMNRAERRATVKKLTKNGVTRASAETFVKRMNDRTQNPVTTWEGEKVKLDYNRISTYPDWPEMRKEYREWVTTHKDDVFTVEFDPVKKKAKSQNVNKVVQFVEDTTSPKWLFFAGDLIPEPNQEKPKTDYELHMADVDNIIAGLRDK